MGSPESVTTQRLPAEHSGVSSVPARPIRVVHLIHSVAYGGVETALINWLVNVDRSLFEISLICFANPGDTHLPFAEAAERYGLKVETIPLSRRKPVISAARRLRSMMRDKSADILHSHNCYADVVAAVAALRFPVKTITTLYVWEDFGFKRNLIQKVDEIAIRYLDKVTAHCEETRIRTIQRGFDEAAVNTLICGFQSRSASLSPGQRREGRARFGAGDEHIVLANVARFYPEKTQDGLLRSFLEINRRHPETRLWIAGVGPLEDSLKALCSELGLDDRVTFVGFVADLSEFMALVDIQVHPAHTEGVALAICEGMAAGLPIVASRVGGLPEVLHHDSTGVLVPPRDEAAFAEAVCELIEDAPRRARIGAAARRFIEQDYSLEKAVGDLQQTYRDLLAS
jgi:glycosyltransferase involved in cell wall biosynthesis